MIDEYSVQHMQMALALAQRQRGFCAPNPSVGAVITRDNKILATGFHLGSGHPHAEIEALKLLNHQAQGATLYVTLEPCCHFGKTPPCTDAIINSGIRQVYFGLLDPNPLVAGKGVAALEKAGIACELIDLAEIRQFYASYIYWTQHRRPWVTAKIALSLDGKIAGADGIPVKITGPELQSYTHTRRLHSDAILTTINTILKDDPQLNVRLDSEPIKKSIYILDSQLRLPLQAKIFQTAKKITLFCASSADASRKKTLLAMGIRCEVIAETNDGLNLSDVLSVIGADGVHDLWVEAGGRSFQHMVQEKLLNTALIYVSPKILGEQATTAFSTSFSLLENVKNLQWTKQGMDGICEIQFTAKI